MGRWGWCPFDLERGREIMGAGKTSLNFIAATLPASNSLCISQCNIIFLFKLQIYFITVVRLYWAAWIFGHRIEKKENFWQKRYQYFRKKSEGEDFNRHFKMQLKIVNLPPLNPTFSCLHTGVNISRCRHFLMCLLSHVTEEISLLGKEKLPFHPVLKEASRAQRLLSSLSSLLPVCLIWLVLGVCSSFLDHEERLGRGKVADI